MELSVLVRKALPPASFCVALIVAAVMIPANRVIMLGTFMAFSALAITLGLMVGMGGMLALGHAAFFGAGAYISTILNQVVGWSLPASMLVAVVISTVGAVIVGAAASARTAGLYFAVVTFAFGELLVALVNNTTSISGGSEGLPVRYGLGEQMPFGFSLDRYFAVVIGVVLLVTVLVAVVVRTSQFGLRLKAIKESEDLARGLGFAPTFYKASAFTIGSMLAALIGTVYAPMVGFINPELMNVHQSIYILGLLFVGGVNSISGAFLGVGLLTVVPRLLDLGPTTRPLLVGVAMGIVVLVEPDEGVAGLLRRGAEWLRSLWRPPDRADGASRGDLAGRERDVDRDEAAAAGATSDRSPS